jgi:hypothetical protein
VFDFFQIKDEDVCNAQEKPFICGFRTEIPGSDGAIAFTPSDKPSKFVEDNDAGNTLIGDKIKKGPIGEGIKTSVRDNGDSTFTAGNLTTFSRSFALQLGCLFDVRVLASFHHHPTLLSFPFLLRSLSLSLSLSLRRDRC